MCVCVCVSYLLHYTGLMSVWCVSSCVCLFSDLQIVNIGLRVLYRPDPLNLPTIYRFLGADFDERVLPSITNEVCLQLIVFLLHV